VDVLGLQRGYRSWMSITTQRPDRQPDEFDAVMGWYRLQRGIVRLKCDGLSDEDAHRSVIPTSPLMTVAGIVSHLRWAEELWFGEVLLGRPGIGTGFDGVEDSEFQVADVPLVQLLDEYEAACDGPMLRSKPPGSTRPAPPRCTRSGRRRCAGWCCTCSRRRPATSATSTSFANCSTGPRATSDFGRMPPSWDHV